MEDIDLLVRWLGPESARQPESLQTANLHYAEKGLKCIWKRLDERHGSPELTKSTLKEKIARFTKFGNSEVKRLYDLSDILAEIEASKRNAKYENLLSYFDSSRGMNPILSKLPYFLQNKWTDRTAKHMSDNGVVYPPLLSLSFKK